jgi:hypothetical protein
MALHTSVLVVYLLEYRNKHRGLSIQYNQLVTKQYSETETRNGWVVEMVSLS